MGVHRAYVVLQYRTATKSAIFERNRKSMTAEQELEYDKHASYDLLKGLRKFCLKNPDAKIAKAMYDSKLAAYKRRFGLEENETVELIKKEFCNI
jgi:putative IMPACT (imprinted ancient) family translation regulator